MSTLNTETSMFSITYPTIPANIFPTIICGACLMCPGFADVAVNPFHFTGTLVVVFFATYDAFGIISQVETDIAFDSEWDFTLRFFSLF